MNSDSKAPKTPSDFQLVAFCSRPDLLTECINLLNTEWPRSEQSRRITFEKCCSDPKELPQSLLMLDGGGKLIGHSRVCAVVGKEHACWIESVVVAKHLRGQGYGRALMEASEKFARSIGLQSVYLSTHDQHNFYHKLGYVDCPPVCVMGANAKLLQSPMFANLRQKIAATFDSAASSSSSSQNESLSNDCSPKMDNSASSSSSPTTRLVSASLCVPGADTDPASTDNTEMVLGSTPVPPPPPPPSPLMQPKVNFAASTGNEIDPDIQYMKKDLNWKDDVVRIGI